MTKLSINKNNVEEIKKEIIDYEDRVYKKYKKEIKEYFSSFYKRGCELRVGREWFNEKKNTHSKKRLEIEDGYRYRIYCILIINLLLLFCILKKIMDIGNIVESMD